VATLAAQFFSDWMFLRIKWFTNNSPRARCRCQPAGAGHAHRQRQSKYLFCLALVVLGLLAKNLVRGAIGREDGHPRHGRGRRVIGIRPMYAKLSAFAVSSFIVGVAGALWGLCTWVPGSRGLLGGHLLQLLFMVIIGGLGSIMGSFFGAAFIVVLPIVLNQVLPAWLACSVEISTAAVSHAELMIFGG
jgi:branched-chain amino acid transport system permease protein